MIRPCARDGFVNASRRRTKRGWQAIATSIAGNVQLTAYAYCTPGD